MRKSFPHILGWLPKNGFRDCEFWNQMPSSFVPEFFKSLNLSIFNCKFILAPRPWRGSPSVADSWLLDTWAVTFFISLKAWSKRNYLGPFGFPPTPVLHGLGQCVLQSKDLTRSLQVLDSLLFLHDKIFRKYEADAPAKYPAHYQKYKLQSRRFSLSRKFL